MKIVLTQNSAPAEFAAAELGKYAFLMKNGPVPTVYHETVCKKDSPDTIRLGLLSDFDLPDDDVQDAFIEDVIDINIKNGSGYIAGSNQRSILMGVYNYLKSAGCMWVRPGDEGEFIPEFDLSNHSYTYRKKADYPFRGECTEGTISYEGLRDMIYWLPKVGMNMMMIEGEVPYIYMNRWYVHMGNTFLRQKGDEVKYEAMVQYIDRCEYDIQKTGVQFHAVGHGWMFSELGVKNGHTHKRDEPIRDEDMQYIAMNDDGVRDLGNSSLFYSNFCYSNPEARKKLVNYWVKYAKSKPYIDYFHVWLGDSRESACRCAECQKKEFSDWYVMLLNEIDEALTANNITARFVFIMYVYTHRPPKETKIKNPDRYMLLYACGIDYGEGYKVYDTDGIVDPPYDPKRAYQPDQKLGAKWREDWKRVSGAKLSCVYEYRYYLSQYADPGYMLVARETHRDMKKIKELDYQGCMSDQTMRMFLPTGLPMAIMAETLFDTNLDFEDYTNKYFTAAFGEDGAKCREYLEKLSEYFSPNLIRHDVKISSLEEVGVMEADAYSNTWYNNPKAAEGFAKVPALVEEFLPVIEKNKSPKDICQMKSWRYLQYHAYIVTELSKAYLAGAKGDKKAGAEIYLKLVDWLSVRDAILNPVFDLYLFDKATRKKFDLSPIRDYVD